MPIHSTSLTTIFADILFSIVAISACTANGDVDKLTTSLHEGLNAGLTVNGIKKILV